MIEKYTLKNGLTIVAEKIDYAQSVLMGIWVKAGSRHESAQLAGISHFLEHMNFKGTERRSARELAEVLENRGGQLNAYTTKEYTNFYCHVVKEDYALAMDVLSDLFLHSVYDEEELEKEKNVVLEEINLYEDSPEDLVIDKLNEVCWKNHALGRPILGYEEQVKAFSRDILLSYRKEMYTPKNTVFAVVGNFDIKAILAEAEHCFSSFGGQGKKEKEEIPVFHGGTCSLQKDIAQEHIAIAFSSCSIFDEHYYSAVLLNEYLGGGASSELFQKIREELALSYSVYSFLTPYEDSGMLTIYAGTAPNRGKEVEELCLNRCFDLKKRGIPTERLNHIKQQINGAMRLSVDSLGSRLNRLGRNELFFHRYIPIEEIVSGIDAVGNDDIAACADRIFRRECFAKAVLRGK